MAVSRAPAITFFPDGAAFRAWLEKHHDQHQELILGFYKTRSARKGITYAEARDEALCHGWIDGVRTGIDEDSYKIRFTPRKPKSIWSAINIERVADLTAKGKMASAGVRAFAAREEHRSRIYSFETEEKTLSPAFEKQFRTNKKAWADFQERPPSYRRTAVYLVMSAKKEETRAKRLGELIAASEKGERIKPLDYVKKPAKRGLEGPTSASSRIGPCHLGM